MEASQADIVAQPVVGWCRRRPPRRRRRVVHCACIYTRTYIPTYTYTCIYVIYAYICIYIHLYIDTCVCVCVCVHTHTHTHTYIWRWEESGTSTRRRRYKHTPLQCLPVTARPHLFVCVFVFCARTPELPLCPFPRPQTALRLVGSFFYF